MLRYVRTVVAFVLITLAPAIYALPVLQMSGPQLTGALGVEVGGELFDVEFVDGTCIEAFAGCDSLSDFAFNSYADATLASTALLDQVFTGIIDMFPTYAAGCEHSLNCWFFTPFAIDHNSGDVIIAYARNSFVEFADHAGPIGYPYPVGFTLTGSYGSAGAMMTWAHWSPQGTTVPEPGTLALWAFGLFAITWWARRRTKRGALLTP